MVAREEIQGQGEGASRAFHVPRVLDVRSPFIFLSRTPV